jgi:hypothetical protein
MLTEAHSELALARGEPDARAQLAAARDGFASEGWRIEADRVAARLAALG